MWPKALAQLIELLPHMARLLPMADRFLSAKTADTEASRAALEQMAAGVRGDLGQVTAAHAGLYRQLNEQSERLSTLTAEQRSTRESMEAMQARLTRMEHGQRVLQALTVVTLLVVVVGLVILLVRKP